MIQYSFKILLRSNTTAPLVIFENYLAMLNLKIQQKYLQWEPLRTELRSTLRSPHVNKNKQEHFHGRKIRCVLVSSVFSKLECLKLFAQVCNYQKRNYAVEIKVTLISRNEAFKTFF